MTYTTLTYNGTEKCLADWNIGKWRRETSNQAGDSFGFDLVKPMDGAEDFPWGSMITISIGRKPNANGVDGMDGVDGAESGLPLSGVTSWTGGKKWFVGYRVKSARAGTAALERFAYQFAGPWEFLFERLIYQQLWLTYSNALGQQVADYRDQVVLGQALNVGGNGAINAVLAATNVLSIAQSLIMIAQYVATCSAYEQSVNGLGWPAGPQIQTDALTTDANGNYQLKLNRTYVTIPDFIPGFAGADNDLASTTKGLVLRAPLNAVNQMSCAECMRYFLKRISGFGSAVAWFDYTTSPPTLHISTRDRLAGVTLSFPGSDGSVGSDGSDGFGGSVRSVAIERRDDLVPSCVAFKYRVSGSDFGIPYSYIVNDVAATVGGAVVEGIGQWSELTELDGVTAIAAATQTALSQQERRPAAQLGTFDFQGQIIKGVKGSILTMPLNLADPAGEGAALAFWQGLFPELANVSGLAFYQDPGGAVAPLVVDPTGAAINTGVYGNILLDGQVAPWMQAGNISTGAPAQCVHATITAYFSYADNSSPAGDTAVNAGAVQCHAKTIQLKLTNLTAGNFSSVTGVLSAEAIPYGLAGYIYGIETIPQYQGKLTLVEQEISDACPIGSVLNLSGGRAEWAAMNACVQRVNYDDCGRTEIVFGPAEHLDIADIVAMNRFNRGPRWLYEVGSDQMNAMPAGQGTVALGSHVPLAAPSPGNAVRSDLLIPQSLKDLQSHQSGYTKLLPGVYAWSKGAQKSGLSLLDAGPGLALAGGSDGTLDGQYVVISVAQLLSVVAGQPVKFFELNTCENGDSTYYRTFLCTDKYHHP